MPLPRSLGNGCASATSIVIADADSVMESVDRFMCGIGAAFEGFAYARTCSVSHPDGLACRCKMEVFVLPAGGRLLDITRLTGDAVLFAWYSVFSERSWRQARSLRLFPDSCSSAVGRLLRWTLAPCPRSSCRSECGMISSRLNAACVDIHADARNRAAVFG